MPINKQNILAQKIVAIVFLIILAIPISASNTSINSNIASNNLLAIPTVLNVNSTYDTGDGILENNEITTVEILQLHVDFSELMYDPVGSTESSDVTNKKTIDLWHLD